MRRRSWTVRTGVLALCAGVALAAFAPLTGCARREGTSAMLELVLETAPNRLDPAFAIDVAEGEICSLVYDGLVGFAPDGSLVPGIARTWEAADGRTYRFHLDPRARFSGGRAVRAPDVVASFLRVLAPATGSPRAWVLERIRGAAGFRAGRSADVPGLVAENDSTLRIELEAPFAPFLSMLALPAARVVDLESLAGSDGALPAGAGPWMVAEWVRADRVTLVPNPHHVRRAGGLAGVRYRVIPEPFTRIAEFESGALDVLEIPDAEVARFRDDDATARRVLSRAELRVVYLGINTRRFPDPRVRRALNHAVNVEQLIRVLAAGQGVRACGAIPPALPGFATRPAHAYDPAQARALLAQAGHAGGLSLEIWQRDSAEGNRLLEAIQAYFSAVGVEATLVRREWSAFKDAVSAGRVDAFLLDWFADYPDAENFLFPLFHSANHGGGGNRSFFTSPDVDSLIETASATIDDATRAGLSAQIDSLVYDQAPWVYLYFPTSSHIVSQRVAGYRLPSLYLGNDFSGVTVRPGR